jgi:hypothetical protein
LYQIVNVKNAQIEQKGTDKLLILVVKGKGIKTSTVKCDYKVILPMPNAECRMPNDQ